MRNLLNPLWLLLINTLPVFLIFIIFYENFVVIKSMLTEENIIVWQHLGTALALLSGLNLLYALVLILVRKKVSLYYSFVALAGYISFLYIYCQQIDNILPPGIPSWMMSDTILLYAGTFLMPTLVYSLFILVLRFTENKDKLKASSNFLYALGVPASLFLFGQVILPLWKVSYRDTMLHTAIIVVILATVVFLFFLMRGMFILSKKKNNFFNERQLLWKIPVTILFPIFGLMLNNGFFINYFIGSGEGFGIFGNFNNLWFPLIALVNGLLLCVPEQQDKKRRLFLYVGKCITFAYTLYFFFIFIPFLPLSVLAILAFGVGFLLLAPLVLTIVQANSINHDYNFLKRHYSPKVLVLAGITSFFVIPASVTCSFLQDKKILDEALAYISTPDYSKKYSISRRSLQSTLVEVKGKQSDSFFSFGGGQTPFLSTLFNWIALDNMKISDSKINKIKDIFFGQETPLRYDFTMSDVTNPDSVYISHLSTRNEYNNDKQYYTTWVDLSLTNPDTTTLISEYQTTFTLPAGCSISDYYLYVGDSLAYGILAEKKAATWIYTQITTTGRDPGILYYSAPNKITFKVFPFSSGETRRTGIRFIHKEPVTIKLDGQQIQLGDSAAHHPGAAVDNNFFCYLPPVEKAKLPIVERTPYYHFLVNTSEKNQKNTDLYISNIKKVMQHKAISPDNARISFVNTYTTTFPMDRNWEQLLKKQQFEGGFFLERGIRKALFTAYKEHSATYPLLVVITDSLDSSLFENNFSDMQITYPENDYFYTYTSADSLGVHSLSSQPYKVHPGKNTIETGCKVYAWPDNTNPEAWLRTDYEPGIILKDSVDTLTLPFGNDWLSALRLQVAVTAQAIYPQTIPATWLPMVKHSFESGIMTPFTSYIVLETEAQRALLMQKQKKVLSGNPLLDLGEDIREMSEPDIIWVALLTAAFIFFIKKKKQRAASVKSK